MDLTSITNFHNHANDYFIYFVIISPLALQFCQSSSSLLIRLISLEKSILNQDLLNLNYLIVYTDGHFLQKLNIFYTYMVPPPLPFPILSLHSTGGNQNLVSTIP